MTMNDATPGQKSKYLMSFLAVFLIFAIPLALWAYPSNPPLGKTGAPGEGTCGDCHSGGSGGGNVAVTSSTGTTYHPGTKQHLLVTITDPSASDWGYEMTAVQASKPTTGKGVFKAVDKLSGVRKSGTKSYAAQTNDQQGKTSKVTFAVDWTPPKKSAGNITLYLAGVGGTGDPSGDSVYTSSLTLTPN